MRKKLNKLLPKAIGRYINTIARFSPNKAAHKAFTVFSRPRRGRVLEHQRTFLENALNEPITVNSLKIQTYHWPGTGKTVLLMHGWESNAHRWKPLIEELQKKNFNIIALDAPGHGLSTGKLLYVPLYEKVFDEALKRFSPQLVIAHSVGAMTTVFHQSRTPAPLEKIVLLGPPDELQDIIGEFQRILGLKSHAIKAFDSYLNQRFGYNINTFVTSAFAKNVATTTLVIHDKEDAITPFYGAERIHESLQDSVLFATQGLTHSLHGSVVYEKIVDFITK